MFRPAIVLTSFFLAGFASGILVAALVYLPVLVRRHTIRGMADAIRVDA